MLAPEDQEFVWRCDHCGCATVLPGTGGHLNCVCPDDQQPHTNFHFQALTPGGVYELEVWYDPNLVYA